MGWAVTAADAGAVTSTATNALPPGGTPASAPTTADDPAYGLLAGAVLLALLAMTLRRLGRAAAMQVRRKPAPQVEAPDFGLLVSVAVVPTHDDADMLREVLVGNGIRATTTAAADDEGRPAVHVLVFPDDARRARELVATR